MYEVVCGRCKVTYWRCGEAHTVTELALQALHAKYSQNEDLQRLLLATGRAKLLHRPPRSKLVVEHELMAVRTKLRAEHAQSQ